MRLDVPPWGWGERSRARTVAVVGATGAVGRELLSLLDAAGHPRGGTLAFARARGEVVLARGGSVPVRPLDVGEASRADLAFLCTPSEVSAALAPDLAGRGTTVVDLSSALRDREDVPLVVPEINGDELARGPRLVANPNCTTAIAALPLAAIDRALHLLEVVVVSYQAASGAGAKGLEALASEMRGELPRASPFPAPLAWNVIPAVAELDESGWSGEERKIEAELRKILRRPDLAVEATTARVAVERCHCVAVHLRARGERTAAEVEALLRGAPGIAVSDDPHGPRPRECAGTDPVHVGRIRRGGRGAGSLCFFAVGDQLRKGAALNALQVAARLTASA